MNIQVGHVVYLFEFLVLCTKNVYLFYQAVEVGIWSDNSAIFSCRGIFFIKAVFRRQRCCSFYRQGYIDKGSLIVVLSNIGCAFFGTWHFSKRHFGKDISSRVLFNKGTFWLCDHSSIWTFHLRGPFGKGAKMSLCRNVPVP